MEASENAKVIKFVIITDFAHGFPVVNSAKAYFLLSVFHRVSFLFFRVTLVAKFLSDASLL